MRHVLDGYRVLDLTQFLAGPSATRLMAEAGAEVIKIEWPEGDPSRLFPHIGPDGRSAYYVQQNRGKKSVSLDLRTPEAKQIVLDLARQSDVVIESYAPGAMDRLGLGYETLQEVKPDIVMCSISAFGQSGPLSQLPGFDNVAQAYAAVTSMMGEPDGPPAFLALGIGDVSTGAHAACAVGFALLHRERTGKGQYLDISLLDSYFHCHEINVQAWSCSGGDVKPARSGSHHAGAAPAGIFRGKDGYLLMLPILHLFARLCEVMGKPELITDERFADNAARVRNKLDLAAIIEGWLQEQDSDEESLRILNEGRIPVAPILSVEQACQHPHLIERETIRDVHDRSLGTFQVPGMPLRFSDYPAHLDLVAPFLGEHNSQVLEGLGYPGDRIAELERAGVLHSEPIPTTEATA